MSHRSRKYLIPIVVLILLILAGVILFSGWIGPKRSNSKFRTAKVERGEIRSIVTATGTINPVVTVLVGSQV